VRSWLVRDYAGFDGPTLPQASTMLIPATLETPLGVYVGGSRLHPPALVMGPSGTYTYAEGPCEAGLMVPLAPLGAYRLLGPAIAEIGGTMVGLEDVVGAAARRLSEQVQASPTWEERARLLDGFLLDRAAQGPQPSPEVAQAWHLLLRSRGTAPISVIASEVGWSHKHLITRFRQQIGVAPQTAARLLRLTTVWRHVDAEQSWARIAAECGYSDQAHLTREFRRFTGTTPGALLIA
jgi:AraC-like DNA-binding protein